MKILHVIASADPRGGGPIEGIRQRGLALLAMGHQPEVLTLDAPGAPYLANFPLPVHAVGPATGSYRWAAAISPWLRAHAHSMLDPWFRHTYPLKHLKKLTCDFAGPACAAGLAFILLCRAPSTG